MSRISGEQAEWFEREVRPILVERCSSCHSQKAGVVKGGLSLDSRSTLLSGGDSGPALAPGHPEESLLIEAVRRESLEMPPEKPLNLREQQTLIQWVKIGAPWPATHSEPTSGVDWLQQRRQNHWAWHPTRKVAVPQLDNDDWSAGPIDRFILRQLRERGLQPATSSEPTALLRRLRFDLVGLPPDPESLATEPTAPQNESAYAEYVESLLSSPQFGVRWGRHWLDLVRYAETLGHEFDYPIRHAWRYRDAVIDTFNTDVPYRQMVMEHLAGDRLTTPRRHPQSGVNQSLALTGFWWLGDAVHAPVDIKSDWAMRIDNQIDVFSKTFLGMTIACARCHDHKFDALSVRDYYGLAGILQSSRREYALTDPNGEIAAHRSKMRNRIDKADDLARQAFSASSWTGDEIGAWLRSYASTLGELKSEQLERALPISSPLYPLRLLVSQNTQTPSASSFQQASDEMRSHLEEAAADFAAWKSDSLLFATFSEGLPAGWSAQLTGWPRSPTRPLGSAWPPPPGPATFDWFSESLPIPNRLGVLASHRLGRRQSLTLRSPTFDVSHGAVCIKMRGKSTQSSVVVDHYFMQEFSGLLFDDLRKPIDQPFDSGWVTHAGDLNKYVGHPAFLSIEDTEQAWFEMEEVRFSDTPPPVPPHAIALAVLRRGSHTPDALIQALADTIVTAFTAFRNKPTSEWNSAPPSPAPKLSRANAIGLQRSVLRALSKHEKSEFTSWRALQSTARALQQRDAMSPEPVVLLTTTDGSPRDASIAPRGNPHQSGAIVPRGCLVHATQFPLISPDSSGRVELARSLIDPRHPLTARVIVNRVWHHLMGRGLVHSPDNLGALGGRPSHPELLDYLAREFMRHDWSIKWLVREIALSKTYRLSGAATESHRILDPDSRLWSHRPVRRLSAEALRDALLQTADSLDLQLSGPSIPIYLNDQMTGRGRPQQSGPLDGANRRSIYVEVRRNFLDPFLTAFDFPMPSSSVGKRNRSNVPAQALGLLNDPFVVELTERWVQKIQSISNLRERIETMIKAAYGRPATPDEIESCLAFVNAGGDSAWRELAHVLLNSKEFSYLK